MHRTLVSKFAAVILLASGAPMAMAAATACDATNAVSGYVGGATSADLQKEDLTLNGVVSTNCYGHAAVGSNSEQNVVAFANNLSLFGGGWTVAARANAGGSAVGYSFGGLSFAISNLTTGIDGSFTLTVTDIDLANPPTLPVGMDLFITTKANTLTDFFFFDDLVVDTTNAGTWSVAIRNKPAGQPGSNYQALSDVTIGVRNIVDGPPRPPQEDVPEPATLALAGLALAGLALSRRRRG